MNSKDISSAKQVMSRYDASLVAAAIQTLDIDESEIQKARDAIREIYANMRLEPGQRLSAFKRAQAEFENELISSEIGRIRDTLKEFDRETVLEAAAEYIGDSKFQYCISSECICPEKGCVRAIGVLEFDHGIYEIEASGKAQLKALEALQLNEKASAVVGVNNRIGFAGLCSESVRCTGRQITVMHKCFSSLYALDMNRESLVSNFLKLAEENPTLHKNMQRMFSEMERNGEL